jgi:hypothetical protein
MPAISLTQLSVTSAAFRQGEPIPKRYTCDGEDVSPDLAWRGVPQGTETFALIMDDPDAPGGTFTHWVYYNIPGALRALPEDVEMSAPRPGPPLPPDCVRTRFAAQSAGARHKARAVGSHARARPGSGRTRRRLWSKLIDPRSRAMQTAPASTLLSAGLSWPSSSASTASVPQGNPGREPPTSSDLPISGCNQRSCNLLAAFRGLSCSRHRSTQIYLHADLAIKERALARTAPASVSPGRYRAPDPLLAFLESLCLCRKSERRTESPNICRGPSRQHRVGIISESA